MGAYLSILARNGIVVFGVAFMSVACGSSSISSGAPTAPKCQVSASNSLPSAPADGASGTIAIETTRDCTWTASSGASWITISPPTEGQGSGTIAYHVAANADPTPRRAMVGVNDAEVAVVQDAAPCRLTVVFSNTPIPATGGTLSLNVAASASSCPWTAEAGVSWITAANGPSRAGNGTATFTVQPNVGSVRTGALTVAGQTFNVTQQALGCDSTLTPDNASIEAAGGAITVQVSTPSGCMWTLANLPDWVTTTDAATGSGTGVVHLNVASNAAPAARQASVTIAGHSFTVTQSAAVAAPPSPAPTPTPPAPASCVYSLTPTEQSATAQGGSLTVGVVTTAGCSWTAATNVAWITVTGGATGNGNGQVTYTVLANAGGARSGTLTVAGASFTVNQSAASCSFALAPTSSSVGTESGSVSVAVTTGAGCAWTAASKTSWLQISSASSGSGSGTVSVTWAANIGPARTGEVTIAGQAFSVSQAAACSFSISPAAQAFAAAGGTGSAAITTASGCAWSAVANAGWLSITSAVSGTGGGTVSFTVAANTTTAQRVGTMTIAGQTLTVTQASPCTFAINPAAQTVAATGGSGSVAITTASGCAWSAVPNAAWLSITNATSGTGGGTVNFNAAANTTTDQRVGSLTIAGQTFTVTQPAPCTYSISPASQTIAATDGTGSVTITTTSGCAWSAASDQNWLSITSPTSGTGNGVVSLKAADNKSRSDRTATVTIAGRTSVVTQAGR